MPTSQKTGYLLPSLEQFKRDLGLLPELLAQQKVSYSFTNRRWLYEQMLKEGYNAGTYEEFDSAMNDKANRDWVLSAVIRPWLRYGQHGGVRESHQMPPPVSISLARIYRATFDNRQKHTLKSTNPPLRPSNYKAALLRFMIF